MSGVSPEPEKGRISRFWAWISQPQTLQKILIVLLTLTFVAFVCVLFSERAGTNISELPGLSKKKIETLKFVGIGMGGLLVALQALMSHKRAKALEDTARTQAAAAKAQARATEEQAKANKLTEQGQRQERLKNAIEHLGNKKDSVRLGGAYELFHLAKDTLEEDPKEKLSQTVLDILCAHIRRTTGDDEYRETHKSKPSEEIQSLLTLLFVQKHEVFKGCHINLQGSWLNGADLRGARLAKAILSGVYLQKADFLNTRLQGAILSRAKLQNATLVNTLLQEAKLHRAYLHGATFDCVRLEGAILILAHLQGTDLVSTYLQGASLGNSYLQGSNLGGVRLQGANLGGANLQGANLQNAKLQGADLSGAHLQGIKCETLPPLAFADRIRNSIGQETDLSMVEFVGGLSWEEIKSLVKYLSDESANRLRRRLKSHISKLPSYQLPEDSHAIIGSYAREEGEKWIAEYNEAMSDVPRNDS